MQLSARPLLFLLCVGCAREGSPPTAWQVPPPAWQPAPVIAQPAQPAAVQPAVLPPPAAQTSSAPPPPPKPRTARIDLLGVTMGLGKPDGSPWDIDFGRAPAPGELAAVGVALGAAQPAAAVLDLFAAPAMRGISKPDVTGRASLVTSVGLTKEFKLRKNQDSFTPKWEGVTWSGVKLDGTVAVRVTLIDSDALEDDPIGSFQITASDIEAAIADGKGQQVKVADQTSRQVLFANVSAFLE